MNNKTNKNITVREATNDDSRSIIDLIFNIWINEYHFDVKREDFPDLHNIEKYYANGLFLVSIVDDKIIGTVACDPLTNEHAVLKRMFVRKEYRGWGIAQQLLNELFEQMRRKKTNGLSFFLSTKESEAIAAKKFYLKNGFRTISQSALPANFPFFYKDDLFMLLDPYHNSSELKNK